MRKYVLITISVIFCLFCSLPVIASEVRIAVLALRGLESAEKSWSPLNTYLSEKLGQKVVFIPTEFVQMLSFCRDNPTQFFVSNPTFYIKAKMKYGADPILTLQMKDGGSLFGGVIITKKGSGIQKIQDIKGKNLICTKFSSAGGWLYPKAVLVENGINPEQNCKTLTEAVTHDGVAYAVRDGKVDVGVLRTGILERMVKEGKINLADFEIINPVKHGGFNVMCSTPLYPEWVLAKMSKAPEKTAEQLRKALLELPPGNAVLKNSEVDTFIEPLDYTQVENMMKILKIDPFRK